MLQTIKKYCDGCQSLQYIWRNYRKNKYCKICWLKFTAPTPKKGYSIKPKNTKRQAAVDQLYAILRKKFFEDSQNHACKAHLPGCEVKACDVHHLYSGSKRELWELDVAQWLPVCRSCHHQIHDILTMEEVMALGLKK